MPYYCESRVVLLEGLSVCLSVLMRHHLVKLTVGSSRLTNLKPAAFVHFKDAVCVCARVLLN